MAEFCLDCWNKLNEEEYSKKILFFQGIYFCVKVAEN